MSNVGVPIKLLFEAEGMKISVEMKSGEIYRGLLLHAEETMNVSLSEVIRTARNGQISRLANVYLRGSGIRFIALPDLLKNAPVFQKVQTMKRKLEQATTTQQQRGGGGGMYDQQRHECGGKKSSDNHTFPMTTTGKKRKRTE